jgi:hypothetical protein
MINHIIHTKGERGMLQIGALLMLISGLWDIFGASKRIDKSKLGVGETEEIAAEKIKSRGRRFILLAIVASIVSLFMPQIVLLILYFVNLF